MQCSFGELSSKPCGIVGDKHQIVTINRCRADIKSHLQKLFLQRDHNIKHEEDLLCYRGGFFDKNAHDLTICPLHREDFGIKWRRSTFCVVNLACGCGGAKKPRMARAGSSVNTIQSKFLWKTENKVIPVGSGECS